MIGIHARIPLTYRPTIFWLQSSHKHIPKAFVSWVGTSWHQQSMERILEWHRWSMQTLRTTPQSDNRALLFLDNNGLSWTVSTPDKVTGVPVRRNGNFQTPISVPAVRPKRCHTLSNPAHRQDYTVACLNYTLQTMMPGWPVMAPNVYDNNNISIN